MKPRQSKIGPQILTAREREILKLIAEGFKNKEIGDRVYVSGKKIREAQIRIMRKLNARSLASVLD